METKNVIWALVIFLLLMQFTGKINFLGAATADNDWSDITTGLVDFVKGLINTIFDLAKQNPLLTVAIVAGLFFMFVSKK